MAVNEDGLWMHQKYGYSVSHRNGKLENVLARCLWVLTHGERVLYTAHRETASHATRSCLAFRNPTGLCSMAGKGLDERTAPERKHSKGVPRKRIYAVRS